MNTSNYNNMILPEVYFKVARTCDTAMFKVNPYWTTTNFIDNMREKVIQHFNLENAEFVDTNQELTRDANGNLMAAEDGPAIEPSNRTLAEIYGDNIYKSIAFYIRPIASTVVAVPEERTCRICLTRERNLVFMPCNHLCACSECGLNDSIQSCPLCRATFETRTVVYI